MHASTSAADLLLTVAEPTRLRILNCLAAAPQFVLYRLRRGSDTSGRLLSAILDALGQDDRLRAERGRAAERSRSHTRVRVQNEVTTLPADRPRTR